MQDLDDLALLREYAVNRSETAFEELVSRRVGLVYSSALRQARDPNLAEEITQVVFIILAQKAGRISDKTILTGWLFKTTRFAALAQMRAEMKRSLRTATIEKEFQMQNEIQSAGTDEIWNQMSPLLDEALAALGETDRQAVLLRFFENKSLAEVGNYLGAGEDTARKRVARALEKLRKFFTKRGVSSTTAIIAGTISANSVQAAPTALAKSVTAVAIAKGTVASGSTLILVKGAMKTMTWLKTTLFTVILTNVIVSQKIVATHFDFAGNPDGWMTHSNYVLSSLMFGCGFPLFFVAIGYLPRFLPVNKFTFKIPNRDYWLAPESRDETFNYLFRHSLWQACFAAIFALALQLLVVQANHQTPPHFSSPLAWMAAGCFVAATTVLIGILLRHFKHTGAV